MKRICLVALAIIMVLSFAACGNENEKEIDLNASENDTLQNDMGYLSVDEDTVKELLSIYDSIYTGLSSDIHDYTFKLSPTSYYGESGVKAEAFLGDSDTAEGVFMVIGNRCYVFNKEYKKYFLLTPEGAFDVAPSTTSSSSQSSDTSDADAGKTTQDIEDENNKVLKERYQNYDLSVVGLTKPISEYTFQVTGKPNVASNGVTVYSIYLLDNGSYTNVTFGIGTDGNDYYYDSVADDYIILS